MLYYLYYSIWGLNGILAILNKKSKVIALFTAIFCWILMWGNTMNPDYYGYLIKYQNQATLIKSEVGYSLLLKVGKILGLDYNTFLLCITLICFLIVFYTISKVTNNLNCFFALYFGFALSYDIVQIRNFIAMSIFIYAIPCLINNEKIKYILLILAAATIHTTALFYLLLVFIKVKPRRNSNLSYKISASIIWFLCVIIFLNGNKIPFLNYYLEILTGDKRVDYYLSSSTHLGFLITFGLQAINFGLVYISKQIIQYNYNNVEDNKLKTILKFVDLIYIVNIVGFFAYPLCMIDGTFYRLFRNFNILNFVLFSATIDSYRIHPKNNARISKIMFITIIVAGMALWYAREMNDLTFILHPILENNLLFK